MNIKDLRELIQDWPDDGEILFEMVSGCCGDYQALEECDATIYQNSDLTVNVLTIHFCSLPGYKTCRQVAGTLKADEQYHKLKE